MSYCPITGQSCHKPKILQIEQNIQGHVEKIALCNDCVEKYIKSSSIELPLVNTIPRLLEGPICASCSSSLHDILQNGKFGCASCYENLRNYLDPIILKTQKGFKKHVGKRPKYADLKKEIAVLQEDMEKAVQEERYEDAAKIRDKLKGFNK